MQLNVKEPSKETYSENKRVKSRQIEKYTKHMQIHLRIPMYNYQFVSFVVKPVLSNGLLIQLNFWHGLRIF